MILRVDDAVIDDAARVHSIAWQDSHRAFCGAQFVALHTPEQQKIYLQKKIDNGSAFYMLVEGTPIGVVSVRGSLIEDLYVLPEQQNKGYGTRLLQFAIQKCAGQPTLWVLENNPGAERLYRRFGFLPSGNRKHIGGKLEEFEFILYHEPAVLQWDCRGKERRPT